MCDKEETLQITMYDVDKMLPTKQGKYLALTDLNLYYPVHWDEKEWVYPWGTYMGTVQYWASVENPKFLEIKQRWNIKLEPRNLAEMKIYHKLDAEKIKAMEEEQEEQEENNN